MRPRSHRNALILFAAVAALVVAARLVRMFDLPGDRREPARARASSDGEVTPAGSPRDGLPAEVVRLYDGDTLRVRVDGSEHDVRLVGVDTPERARDGRPEQPFYREAAALTARLVGNGPVVLVSDERTDDRDRFDRLLRYAYLPDGRLLNAELIREGVGFAFTQFPFDHREQFVVLEAEARAAGRGAWSPRAVRRIGWDRALDHVGAVVSVRGEIVTTRNLGRICFLNFGSDRERHLTVVIREPDLAVFPEPPEIAFRGRTVRVVGRVTTYHGRPQIVVHRPDQITVVGGSS